MNTKSIRISPRHGLNPSLMQCFYCGEDFGVAVPGLLPGDKPAPHRGVWNMEPCPKCAEFMNMGVILIGVDKDRSSDPKNPYRDGNWCVVAADAIGRIIKSPMADEVLRRRVAFIDSETWQAFGLPKAGKAGASQHHGHSRTE